MKSSARKIVLSYFGTLLILFSLMSISLYGTLRRTRVGNRAVTTCITTTAVIATSVNKLAIFLLNPAVSEASNNLGNLP